MLFRNKELQGVRGKDEGGRMKDEKYRMEKGEKGCHFDWSE